MRSRRRPNRVVENLIRRNALLREVSPGVGLGKNCLVYSILAVKMPALSHGGGSNEGNDVRGFGQG